MNEDTRGRLLYKTISASLHLYRCTEPDCGREPTVTLDGEKQPIMQCRYHPAAQLEQKTHG